MKQRVTNKISVKNNKDWKNISKFIQNKNYSVPWFYIINSKQVNKMKKKKEEKQYFNIISRRKQKWLGNDRSWMAMIYKYQIVEIKISNKTYSSKWSNNKNSISI